MSFQVGDRVRLTVPKSINHFAAIGVRPIGSIVEIDPTYFAGKVVMVDDVLQRVKRDRSSEGYYVQLDDASIEPIAYRASELARI